jgi:hypothetical protein
MVPVRGTGLLPLNFFLSPYPLRKITGVVRRIREGFKLPVIQLYEWGLLILRGRDRGLIYLYLAQNPPYLGLSL